MDQNPYRPYPAPPPPEGYAYPVAPTAPDGRPLAGPGDRFLAKLLDGVLIFGAIIVAALPLVFVISAVPDDGPLPGVVAVVGGILIFFGVPYLYDVEYAVRQSGQTLGKKVMKITVIPLQPGAPLTRGAMVRRWLLTMFFNIMTNCYVGFLDPLWLLWDKPYRQCLHDKWPATTVIKVTPPAPAGVPPVHY
jgi:uncharacterized RDD family membrane protein YckC